MSDTNPYRRIKFQAAALFICMAGLLTISMLHILRDNAGRVLRSHANQSAQSWTTYFAQVTPDLETVIKTGQPDAATIAKYRESSKINHIKQFTVLNAVGRPVYTFNAQLPDSKQPTSFSFEEARRKLSAQLVQRMIGVQVAKQNKSVVNAAITPILQGGMAIGALHVVVDQSRLNSVFLEAAFAGGWDILVLVNLVLLACWFMFLLVKRAANVHRDQISRIDELTGLPSRTAFMQELDDALARTDTKSRKTAVMVVKIDRFRELNELLGHDGADTILLEVAKRLKDVAGNKGYAARISGSTFGVEFPDLASPTAASDIGDEIIQTLAKPFMCRGKHIQPKASIGVSLAPDDGTDTATMVKRADIAQFIAKEHGGNQLMFFDPDAASKFARKHELENMIISACEGQLFQLFYQPLYDLETQQLKGFEALIRLPDGSGGMIPPDRFIPAAESMHKIGEIGAWVLFEACRTASNWPSSVSIAINLSPLQFESCKLISDVKQALELSGLAPERLELEITEGLILDNNESIRQQLEEIQAMGIKIALDDFGTGYSSLNYLWRFPFDRIKIDRSFVIGMDESEQAKRILKTIVDLARTMNMPITAEGIETEEHLAYLTELGCHVGQGFYLGRPQPDTEVAATLINNFRITKTDAATELPLEQSAAKLTIVR
ncbi:MAG: bifunctional diguanylate cyclase/phosphodiesterase [Hyphomicrobiales bacterium]|nr:bifunctional diguanylate cyclase/phosphodiesterase [Hyphomicrobiales bacterium]